MKRSLLSIALLSASLFAQSNAVPGLDINLYDIPTSTFYGRRGPAYPNGEAGLVIGHSMANCGSYDLPWLGWVNGSSGTMVDTYPKIAFLIARESDGRMVQISGKSFMKHSRHEYNFSGGPCGPCNSSFGDYFYTGCRDTYTPGWNGNRVRLGPTTEVNPWLGSWEPQGSYFDIGDPSQPNYPATADSVQSLNTSIFDPIDNRIIIRESEMANGGTFRAQCHLMIKGEPVGERANNIASRPINLSWSGSSWQESLSGSATHGSVLEHWTGATTSMAGNGNDDGRFLVAVKVTGPVNGMWHYEYAVHNIDNARGGASLRIPVCPTARVENMGFRDIDADALNDWSMTRNGGSIDFLASANNPLDWNTFYNFYFDSDAAPIGGDVTIDEARLGPGALSVDVSTTVPGLLGSEYLGAGCGSPTTSIYGNGVPSSPNPAYSVVVNGTPANFALMAISDQQAALPIGTGCTLFIDPTLLLASDLITLDGAGTFNYSIPIPAALPPVDLAAQVIEFYPGGPFLTWGGASNGLLIRAAGTGCP